MREGIAVVAAIVVVTGFLFFVNGTNIAQSPDGSGATASVLQDISNLIDQGASGGNVITRDLAVGDGAEAVSGSQLTVHYIGLLPSGEQFDNSVERGEPFVFELGAGSVISGWESGLVGMREGGRRVLVVPPEMGYGSQSVGNIPPNSTLIFEVLLLEVE
jgi:FKBP-type peptidyl-prolyl cis-trans isomerase